MNGFITLSLLTKALLLDGTETISFGMASRM